jgi:hypothetical protein
MQKERFDDSQLMLSCWKDIARYLGKGVRTVQRWERDWELPVRRLNGANAKGPVVARTADLDRWLSDHWSEAPAQRKHRQAPAKMSAIQAENDALRSNLIEASRALREANKALVKELAGALKLLHATCSQLEVVCSNGKPTRIVSGTITATIQPSVGSGQPGKFVN